MTDLETVLADAREEVGTLRRYGQADVAGAVEAMLDRLVAALHEFTTWHDETGAALLSGKGPGYFRSRFDEWQRRGLARSPRRGVRQYRECVVPKRVRLAELDADAERTAREDAA